METQALTAVEILKNEIPLNAAAEDGAAAEFVLGSGGAAGRRVGLVLIDLVNGFCTVGAGNLVRI